ncbi:hypothetical protein BV898_17724 [Hypsibius exemplaris]|uniref:Uncharacterized protein n=1 Tax=Hypsibius exemplaris TaxID=2072580 RepID=A0A9X6NG48_HYPEX|nr:hypothetical protein BV898_17724 [Hypsibius exemplaris]
MPKPVESQFVSPLCNGSFCGCYKSWCWAYVNGLSGKHRNGDPWCYTSKFGVAAFSNKDWKSCSKNGDCNIYQQCAQNLRGRLRYILKWFHVVIQ